MFLENMVECGIKRSYGRFHDVHCGDPAQYSLRKTLSDKLVEVGADEGCEAVCRA
ncbi:MAG: hypothetical protein JG782_1066 [Anaerophaga sp.]|nr:hypothetical protein [Anaerophaga sp.]MDK2842398.1 hypothetical protein [Anaerophaga sp.]